MRIYTVGHSNVRIEALLDVLTVRGVEVVADLRSRPYSRFAWFNQRPLRDTLSAIGIEYRYFGDRLGRPADPDLRARWTQGAPDASVIDALRATPEWHAGLDDLASLVRSGGGVCLLCSERDPANCHRSAVVADLAELLACLDVVHLDARGRRDPGSAAQPRLFEER